MAFVTTKLMNRELKEREGERRRDGKRRREGGWREERWHCEDGREEGKTIYTHLANHNHSRLMTGT